MKTLALGFLEDPNDGKSLEKSISDRKIKQIIDDSLHCSITPYNEGHFNSILSDISNYDFAKQLSALNDLISWCYNGILSYKMFPGSFFENLYYILVNPRMDIQVKNRIISFLTVACRIDSRYVEKISEWSYHCFLAEEVFKRDSIFRIENILPLVVLLFVHNPSVFTYFKYNDFIKNLISLLSLPYPQLQQEHILDAISEYIGCKWFTNNDPDLPEILTKHCLELLFLKDEMPYSYKTALCFKTLGRIVSFYPTGDHIDSIILHESICVKALSLVGQDAIDLSTSILQFLGVCTSNIPEVCSQLCSADLISYSVTLFPELNQGNDPCYGLLLSIIYNVLLSEESLVTSAIENHSFRELLFSCINDGSVPTKDNAIALASLIILQSPPVMVYEFCNRIHFTEFVSVYVESGYSPICIKALYSLVYLFEIGEKLGQERVDIASVLIKEDVKDIADSLLSMNETQCKKFGSKLSSIIEYIESLFAGN